MAILKGGAMLEADWEGNILWRHRVQWHHHDGRRTESGGTIYLALYRVPDDFEETVKGGIPMEEGIDVWADELVEVDAEGNRVWSWLAHEHMDVETEVLTFNHPRENWTHGNTVGHCLTTACSSVQEHIDRLHHRQGYGDHRVEDGRRCAAAAARPVNAGQRQCAHI